MKDKIPKIWGTRDEIFRNASVQVCILSVKKGYECSYHNHTAKINYFFVISGEVKIVYETGEIILNEGQGFTIYPPLFHKFVGQKNSLMLEIAYVELEESDIRRKNEGGKVGRKESLP